MARRITKGVIKEAFRTLGTTAQKASGELSDQVYDFARIARTFADSAGTTERKMFKELIDGFGGVVRKDGANGFVTRRADLYGSGAPVYSGEQNFVIKKLRPEDVEVIPPSWNRSGADFVMGGGSGPEYTGPVKGSTELSIVSSNTGLAQRRLDNTADMARDAYVEQDITSRINNMDAAAQARAQQKAADAKRAEFLGRNGRREDGSRMGFFERRNAKKYYQNQDWLTNADKYANGEVDINGIAKNNAESGAGWFDGIPDWVKMGGVAVAGGIAGSILADD